MPGCHSLEHRLEFSGLAKALFPRWLYLLLMLLLVVTLMAANISSIIVSAQVMDNAILKGAGKTCALVMYTPHDASPALPLGFQCISSQSPTPTDSPFGSSYVLSLGYIVVGENDACRVLSAARMYACALCCLLVL